MIDIHAHIIPGIDDGADSMSIALAMARDAWESGVRGIIATPHCAKPGGKSNFFSQELLERLSELQYQVWQQGIGLRLYPGMEIFVTQEFRQQLESGKFLSLAGSGYLLVEFYFDESPTFIAEALKLIRSYGLIPVIAHPERYFCVEWDPNLAAGWADDGCVLQLNRGSIQGKLGQDARKCAWELLRREKAHVVASDAHGSQTRRTELRSVMLELGDKLSWSYASKLLVENPRSILKNQRLNMELQLPEYLERK